MPPSRALSDLELIALGVGDAFSARHYSTCLAVRHVPTGEWLLLDCPHPIHKILREGSTEAQVDLPLHRLRGIVISHLHADHCSGLEGLGYYARYRMRDPKSTPKPEELPLLIAGPGVADVLARHEHDRGPDRAIFQVRELCPGEELRTGPFRIENRRTHHGDMACYAYKVEDPAAGGTLAYSADTVLDPELIGWLAEATCIVHEVGSPTPGTKNHTSYGELYGYLEQHPSGQEIARKLYLAHYGDEFESSAARLNVLRQGRKYAV